MASFPRISCVKFVKNKVKKVFLEFLKNLLKNAFCSDIKVYYELNNLNFKLNPNLITELNYLD